MPIQHVPLMNHIQNSLSLIIFLLYYMAICLIVALWHIVVERIIVFIADRFDTL